MASSSQVSCSLGATVWHNLKADSGSAMPADERDNWKHGIVMMPLRSMKHAVPIFTGAATLPVAIRWDLPSSPPNAELAAIQRRLASGDEIAYVCDPRYRRAVKWTLLKKSGTVSCDGEGAKVGKMPQCLID